MTLSVAGGVVKDAAGDSNAAAPTGGGTVNYPVSGPSVSVAPASGQPSPTGKSPINFTVTFSQPVPSFTSSEVSFAGSTAQGTLSATVTAVSGSTPNTPSR